MKKVLLVVLSLVFLASGLFIVSCKQQETAQEATEAPGYGEKAEEAAQGKGQRSSSGLRRKGQRSSSGLWRKGQRVKKHETIKGFDTVFLTIIGAHLSLPRKLSLTKNEPSQG
jgi:hypothetical protein